MRNSARRPKAAPFESMASQSQLLTAVREAATTGVLDLTFAAVLTNIARLREIGIVLALFARRIMAVGP